MDVALIFRETFVVLSTLVAVLLAYPNVTLQGNDQFSVLIYLPDPENGYYRSSRFDWSQQVGEARLNSAVFFGDWRVPHDPAVPEHGVGVAEEYGMYTPLGFDEAAVGDVFLKIGVGRLVKNTTTYDFNAPYPFAEVPLWDVNLSDLPKEVSFRQTEFHQKSGYGYELSKKIWVDVNEQEYDYELKIEHSLKNTGNRAINTTNYCHNLLRINNQDMLGEGYQLTLPFEPKCPSSSHLQDFSTIDGDTIVFDKPMSQDDTIWCQFEGLDGIALINSYSCSFCLNSTLSSKTCSTITAGGNVALMMYRFYAAQTVLAPEPWLAVVLNSGESITWQDTYSFLSGWI